MSSDAALLATISWWLGPAVLGTSPIDFVHEIRLDEATFLLRTTNQTVDAIAAAPSTVYPQKCR